MARFTCTVCVPHVDTPGLLKHCLHSIVHYRHPQIDVEVIVVDQSTDKDAKYRALQWDGFKRGNVWTRVIEAPKIDAGYPIDLAVRMAEGEYFCSLDVDCFPIHTSWLATPIEMVARRGYSFVGCDTDLGKAYPHLGGIDLVNNFYRVSTTILARRASEEIGFMRPQNRDRAQIKFHQQPPKWPEGVDPWHDNGVLAQWWTWKCYGGLRPGLLPITRYLSRAHGKDDTCVYGMIVGEMVFHLVYGYYPDTVDDIRQQLGQDFVNLHRRLEFGDDSSLSSIDLIRELVSRTQRYDFVGW